MTLAVLSAMEVEMEQYMERCAPEHSTQRAGRTVHEAEWQGHDLILVQTGVGKVNASSCTQLLIDRYDVDAVLCTGSAGALNPALDIGDVVVATDCVQHDVVVDFLGLPRGQIPFTDLRFFETSPSLRRGAAAVTLPEHSIVEGRVLTGDTFVEDAAHRHQLREELDGDCVEMEGAAVGQVCAMNDVPYLVVRAISDHADGTSDVDFGAFMQEAARSSSEIVLSLLSALEAGEALSAPGR
ncbi:5'-methylthioadenosine/adenosylhomocysteine nucleosidase [Salinibacter grassmerensis]|uniref:5'-methylthioadenosine/adenosylhomocysteine nucleosidase n=1 Tax=Salinibacter grassmerensis TaxID=3040353 RepID=UPI0021E77248|nr:5'-methylthioadenosine/adenosylhomocysteine nucleosidase [Salinibacter grassmerensis]